MRRGRVRQAQFRAQGPHARLHDAGLQPLAPRAEKNRCLGVALKRALARIVLDQVAHLRQQRHVERLAARADHAQHFAQRQHVAVERQRLVDAKPGPVKESQHRAVARLDPRRRRAEVGGIEKGGRVFGVQRLGHALGQARPAQGRHVRVVRQPLPVEEAEEAAQRRKRAGVGRRLQPRLHAPGKEAAEIGGLQRCKGRERRRFAQMVLQEGQEIGEVARVVGERVARGALLVAQRGLPAFDRRQQVGRRREARRQFPRDSHPRSAASTVRPRKLSSSVPWPGWNFEVARAPKARMPGGMSRLSCRRSSAWLCTSVEAPP